MAALSSKQDARDGKQQRPSGQQQTSSSFPHSSDTGQPRVTEPSNITTQLFCCCFLRHVFTFPSTAAHFLYGITSYPAGAAPMMKAHSKGQLFRRVDQQHWNLLVTPVGASVVYLRSIPMVSLSHGLSTRHFPTVFSLLLLALRHMREGLVSLSRCLHNCNQVAYPQDACHFCQSQVWSAFENNLAGILMDICLCTSLCLDFYLFILFPSTPLAPVMKGSSPDAQLCIVKTPPCGTQGVGRLPAKPTILRSERKYRT